MWFCDHNAQKLKSVHCTGYAQASHGDCGHIAWAASKFAPNLFITRNDKLMTIASPAARPATPRIRMFGPRCYWQPHAPP